MNRSRVAGGVLAVVALTGCSTAHPQTAADRSAIVLPAPDPAVGPESAGPTRPGGRVDPAADLEVDDQAGAGRSVRITAVSLRREPALLLMRDSAGSVLMVMKVVPHTQPVEVPLDRPVPVSQELVAALVLDDGDGRFERRVDRALLEDDGEPVTEDFWYTVQ